MATSTCRKIFGLHRTDLRVLTGARRRELSAPDGRLPRCTDGGDTLVYYDKEGDTLCAACASNPSEPVVAYDISWEGPSDYCAECNSEIPSSYGDPDSED